MSLLIIGLCGKSVFLTVDHFHRPQETLHASSLFTEPGGKGYNQAVAAARMGAEVVFAGAIGWDADGEACVQRLEQEGVKPFMFKKPEQTAYAAILTDRSGENRVTVFSGAQMTAEDVRALKPQFAAAKMLLLTPEIPEVAFAQAIRMAKEHGVRTVINPAPYFPWVEKYLSHAWLITPNRAEACMLLRCEEEKLMERLNSAPYERVAVTLGSEGAVCIDGGRTAQICAAAVRAVDTTGAGDCFNGVLCALLLQGMELSDALEKAVRAASASVEHAHVLDGMPRRELFD